MYHVACIHRLAIICYVKKGVRLRLFAFGSLYLSRLEAKAFLLFVSFLSRAHELCSFAGHAKDEQ